MKGSKFSHDVRDALEAALLDFAVAVVADFMRSNGEALEPDPERPSQTIQEAKTAIAAIVAPLVGRIEYLESELSVRASGTGITIVAREDAEP